MHPYNPTQPLAYNPTPDNHLNYGPWNGNAVNPPQQAPNSKTEREEMPSWNGFSLPSPEEELQAQRHREQQSSNQWGGLYQQGTCPPYPPYESNSPDFDPPPNMTTCPPYSLYLTQNAAVPPTLRTEEPQYCKL